MTRTSNILIDHSKPHVVAVKAAEDKRTFSQFLLDALEEQQQRRDAATQLPITLPKLEAVDEP